MISQSDSVSVATNGFEKVFEETVTTSISDLLGESSMQAIIFHLKMERLGGDPGLFDQRLRALLGQPAAIIEEMILKDLFKRLDLLYAPSGPLDFQKYTKTAKEVFLAQEKRRQG